MVRLTMFSVFFAFSIPSAYPEGLRDIKGPVSFPPNYLLWFILCGLVFLIIILAGLYIFRNKIGVKNKISPKSPYEIAYEKLARLKEENLPAKGLVKEYYFQLSNIIRHYIEERFNIRAPEMTTDEFLFSLKGAKELSSRHKELLREFLTLCDMVKFAKFAPGGTEIENSFVAAKKFIDETKPEYISGGEN